LQQVLCRALEEISLEKQYQEKCLLLLVRALLLEGKTDSDVEREYLFSKYQLMVSSVLMASLPRHFPGMRTS
jgi:anaphase-promoting complex subunit 2